MKSPHFETCPLRAELDTALVEKLLGITGDAIRMQHEGSTPSKEEVDLMATDDEAQAWEDHHDVEEKMAAECAGATATGECCQPNKFQEAIKNFGQ